MLTRTKSIPTFLRDIVMLKTNTQNFMTQNKNQNTFYTQAQIICYGMFKFVPTSGFKWIYPKEFDSNKYTNNSSKTCDLEVGLKYSKELYEQHN